MALRVKTVEYAFDTKLTTLATNTTLGTATRHDFTAITLSLPETTSRTFRSVKVVLSWRCGVTVTASNYTGWRVGIKLAAVAFSDTDYSPTAQTNTGDHECSFVTHDVTSYFVTNFGAGATQTCQVGFAVSQAAANAVNNITCKLLITYEYNDSSLTEEVKTVRIPIQSHHALLTNSQQEIGTTGGTNNAAANQIPILTGGSGFLPEATVVIKQAWIEVWANDAGAAATDFNAFYQIDSVTEVTRATLEEGLNNGTFFYDIFIYDTATYATTSAHAFKARSSTTSRFDSLGGVLHVTYSYDPSTTTTVLNSLHLGLGGEDMISGYIGSTASTDQDVVDLNLWVEEPATVTMKQSGVLLFLQSGAGATFRVLAGGQAERSYTLTALVNAGGHALVHRCDHGTSPWSVVRGLNSLKLSMYTTTADSVCFGGGYAIINYTSAVATGGVNVHNKSTFWSISDMQASAAAGVSREITTTNQRTPNIPETNYLINDVSAELIYRFGSTTNAITMLTEELSGELDQDGWLPCGGFLYTQDGELNTTVFVCPCISNFNTTNQFSGRLNIETARKYRLQSIFASLQWLSGLWVTYHGITYSITGTITGSAGGTVNLTALDTTDFTKWGITSRSGNGSYTITVYDNTRSYFTEARESSTLIGRSDNGTPT